MVAKPTQLEKTKAAIREALQRLVAGHEGNGVWIEPNEWGHLSVTVGSDRFKGLPEHDRDDIVWRHLRDSLGPADFGQLSDINVLDRKEYEGFMEMNRWINRAGGGDPDYPADDSV